MCNCKPTYFCIFVFIDNFEAINFRGLQKLTVQGQCRVCLYEHFGSDLFSLIFLSPEIPEIYHS